jgi:hypothetical protein
MKSIGGNDEEFVFAKEVGRTKTKNNRRKNYLLLIHGLT